MAGDVVSHPIYDPSKTVYGFINRTEYLVGENRHPLFSVEKGMTDSKEGTKEEGTLYKNFFGTWQLGPILLRNPALLREFLHRLLGNDYVEIDTTYADKALELTLADLK